MGRCNFANLIDGLADGTTQPPDGGGESQLTTRPDIDYEVTTFSEGVLTTNPDSESTGYPSFTVTVTLPSTTTMPPPPTPSTPVSIMFCSQIWIMQSMRARYNFQFSTFILQCFLHNVHARVF